MLEEHFTLYGYNFVDVFYLGLLFGSIILAPLIHCFLLLGDILLECLYRYKTENRSFLTTLKGIFSHIKEV